MIANPAYPQGSFWWIDHAKFEGLRLSVTSAGQPDGIIESKADTLYTVIPGGTAVVDLIGPIEKRPSLFGSFFGMASAELITAGIEQAASDRAVRNILIKIDSPGGSVDGLAELGDAVYKARERKRVVAQISGMAASAAYYVAAQAHRVFAGRMDLVGSIGAYLLLYDFSESFEQAGVKPVLLASEGSDQKAAGAMGTEITADQQASLQKIVDAYGRDFRSAIVRGRGMTPDAVKEQSTGELFMAEQALRSGLIDGIRTLSDTLYAMRPKTRRRATEAAVSLMD